MTEQKQRTNIEKVDIMTVYGLTSILISSIVASKIGLDSDLAKNIVEMTLLAGALFARAQHIKAELYSLETLQNISKKLVAESKYKPFIFACVGSLFEYLSPVSNSSGFDSIIQYAGKGAVLAGIFLAAQYFVYEKNIKKYNENNSTSFSL